MRPLVLALALCWPAMTGAETASPYAGMEGREIKTLSETDIKELQRGGGWGLALAAELNGAPGPAHLLELRDEIGLSPRQVAEIEAIFAAMKAEAVPMGEKLIAAEAAIEAAFRIGVVDEADLRALIGAAGAARSELRFIHLKRHLETPPLLLPEQIARYNALRGYGAASPCDVVPDGHDPAMWKMHNGCE
ncbi:Spy/CpxP family protein refolding chaperone [Tabrizicola sp.]|uniref:Spy/CpxP family protein refolding chaperone n=1 Tax=Tabrizicola sp. TaxID=2005166 RepID=UPI00260BF0B6|nr:Spy/CpxP family protein refolding chaperone [Tabrizicola sp.]MDM7931458.1 Spy/CpxP family protein refolding chaperone [Tabrizicola sp.]